MGLTILTKLLVHTHAQITGKDEKFLYLYHFSHNFKESDCGHSLGIEDISHELSC